MDIFILKYGYMLMWDDFIPFPANENKRFVKNKKVGLLFEKWIC